jgi:integrase
MQVVLKGLHKTSKRIADGSRRDYYYAWKGGPAIKADYGTPEFVREFHDHKAKAKAPDASTFASIITQYKVVDLSKRAKATVRSYNLYLKNIEEEFGDMPIAAIEEMGSRSVFLDWRQEKAATPRTADLAWSVLQKIMAFGVKAEKLSRNPCLGIDRLAETGTRREKIWTPPDISKIRAVASEPIRDALLMAIWTGQRQGDLLRLTWSAYTGTHIHLKQSKGKKNVRVKVSKELKTMLDAKLKKLAGQDLVSLTILNNSHGKPWTSDGFRTSWGKAFDKSGVTELTFHDLRGTFITEARRGGSTIDDIASITGHAPNKIRSILETHYMSDDDGSGDRVIIQLERKGNKSPNQTPNRSKPVKDGGK